MEGIPDFDYIENNRGGKQLVDSENYLYHVSSSSEGRTYWACALKKQLNCKGKATIFIRNNVEVFKATHEHNHLASIAKVKAKIMDRETIKEAMANTVTAPSRILAD